MADDDGIEFLEELEQPGGALESLKARAKATGAPADLPEKFWGTWVLLKEAKPPALVFHTRTADSPAGLFAVKQGSDMLTYAGMFDIAYKGGNLFTVCLTGGCGKETKLTAVVAGKDKVRA